MMTRSVYLKFLEYIQVYVLRNLQNLVSLDVSHCPNITDRLIDALVDYVCERAKREVYIAFLYFFFIYENLHTFESYKQQNDR